MTALNLWRDGAEVVAWGGGNSPPLFGCQYTDADRKMDALCTIFPTLL